MWVRSFPLRPQKVSSLWTSWFWTSNLHSKITNICCLSCPAWDAGILLFSNVHFKLLHFYKRPALVPVVTNWKRIQREFSQIKVKSENNAQRWFCRQQLPRQDASWATSVTAAKSGTAHLLTWKLHLASWLQTDMVLNCVSERLCFISFYFVHQSVRYD